MGKKVSLSCKLQCSALLNCAHSGHCTQLRQQQLTKYNQLQLSTLSVFIKWSGLHWKPKVKINLALVSTEQKNCWVCCCWQAHTDSEQIVTSERVVNNCSCLRVRKDLDLITPIQSLFVTIPLQKPVCHAMDHASLQGLIFLCYSGIQGSEGIISSSFSQAKLPWPARIISLRVSQVNRLYRPRQTGSNPWRNATLNGRAEKECVKHHGGCQDYLHCLLEVDCFS